jgi:hypothetical protein
MSIMTHISGELGYDVCPGWTHNISDATKGCDGEGRNETKERGMKFVWVKCTSWNSIIDVLETDMLGSPHLIAIQEHKLPCGDKIKQAKKKAK